MANPDCSELAAVISKIALNLGSRPEFKDLDAVVAEMNKTIPVNRELVADAIVEASRGKARDMTELAKKLDVLKREARSDATLRRRIDEYKKALSSGTLPTPKVRKGVVTPAIQELRQIRNDVAKQVRSSEAAVIDRVGKDIDRLLDQLERRDFVRPAKPPEKVYSKHVEQMISERDLLKAQINQQIANLEPQSVLARATDNLNASRGIITSLDLTAVLRQGGQLTVNHPLSALKSGKAMIASGLSKLASQRINREIWKRENAQLYRKSGLQITSADIGAPLLAREEAFASRLIDKIPLVAGSARAYTAYLNQLRAEVFDTLYATAVKKGGGTIEEARQLAMFVNHSTGRGTLGAFESAARLTGGTFFSPRNVVSRVQLVLGQSMWGGNALTRKIIAKEYAKTLIALGLVYGLSSMGGAEITFDWRSSDFGKIKIGDSRIDILTGISQLGTFTGRLWTGEKKNARTGKIEKLRGPGVEFGKNDMADTIFSFVRSKLAPAPGSAIDLALGQNYDRSPTSVTGELKDLVTPIALGDVYEALRTQGLGKGAALSLLSLLGAGIQIHGDQKVRPNPR